MGRILEAGTREPLEDVVIRVEGVADEAFTDADGRFVLASVGPGSHPARIFAPFYRPIGVVLQIPLEGHGTGVYYLKPLEQRRPYAMEVVTRRSLSVASRHGIGRDDLQIFPTSARDPVRAMQSFPGLTPAPAGLTLTARGTRPTASGIFLDGLQLTLPYHGGALATVIPSELLEGLAWLPGGTSVRYGRTLGGVLELQTHAQKPLLLHGFVEADLLGARAYAQGSQLEPVSQKPLGWSLSVRRSHAAVLANPAVAWLEGLGFRSPGFWDAHLKLNLDPTSQDSLQLLIFAGMSGADRLEDASRLPADGLLLTPPFALELDQARAQLSWMQRLSPQLERRLEVQLGPSHQRLRFDAGELRQDDLSLSLREQLDWQFVPHGRLRAGLDLMLTGSRVRVDVPASEADGGRPITLSRSLALVAPAPYVEGSLLLLGCVLLEPGLRLDPTWVPGLSETLSLDPRVGARAQIGPRLAVKTHAGRFSQPPALLNLLPELSSPGLVPTSLWQVSAGVELKLGDPLLLELVGYTGQISNQIVTGPGGGFDKLLSPTTGLPPDDSPAFSQQGQARNRGIEVLLRRRSIQGFNGWLVYGWLTSDQKERTSLEWERASFLPEHAISAVGVWPLPWEGWFRSRFQLRVGPEVAHTLDVRLEKRWTFSRWRLHTYLEVQNLTDHVVQEPLLISAGGEPVLVSGAPFFPSLGARAEF